MPFFRYFVGTRKKQWRALGLTIIFTVTCYIYWNVYLWYVPNSGHGSSHQKKTSSSRLRDFVAGIPYAKGNKKSQIQLSFATSNNSEIRTSTAEFKTIHSSTQTHDFMKGMSGTSKNPSGQTTSSVGNNGAQNVSYNVHIFYYPWYGNPEHNGRYLHWNHEYLQHWQTEIARKFPRGTHKPPEDIGSDFYPELGCYSSSDDRTILEHFRQIQTSGAGVVVVSWYPRGTADKQGIPVDNLIPKLLNIAQEFHLKITLHIEPYKNRNDKTVRDDMIYITSNYAHHPAFYKYKSKIGKELPLIYVYDSYHTSPEEWANLLTPEGSNTIRNTPYDGVMIALMVEAKHKQYIEIGGFDGFYTYFAVNSFTYGSRWQEWPRLKKFAEKSNSLFIPSIGPGYIDSRVRPWNTENTRDRKDGEYYHESFKSALAVKPKIISITSFNEWHEGTQIEKAVPKTVPGFTYKDYAPHNSDYYLKLTRKFVERFI